MDRYETRSLEELGLAARRWLAGICDGCAARDGAIIACLSGHLGAGKTTFVKAVARELGVAAEITSPTFVIMKKYPLRESPCGLRQIVHIDAYRLDKAADLERIGWPEIVADKGNLVMIEWPENVGVMAAQLQTHLDFEIRDGAHTIVVQ